MMNNYNNFNEPSITNEPSFEPVSEPILTKKKILVVAMAILIAAGIATFAILYEGAGQDVPDSQEVQLDFAAPGSKIAGIQTLVKIGGLTRQQYEKVYAALNKQLPEMEPDVRFFSYVEDSLGSASKDGESAYENIIIAPVSDGDNDEAIEDETENSGRAEMELVDTVLFMMRSESGTEYKVSVYTGGGVTRADVTIEKQ